MPVNMPTHAHGQGYMDLNFVIPELIERVTYHKPRRARVQHGGRSLGAAAGPPQGERRRALLARDGRGRLVDGLHIHFHPVEPRTARVTVDFAL